ncbi:hypothetical protein [Sinomicrobium sp.]
MYTKNQPSFYLFAVLCCALFTLSCSDDDKNNKGSDLLTTENYAYEGDIYKQYLTEALIDVEKEINALQDIIDNNQGNAQVEEDLEAALEQQSAMNAELEGIADLAGIIIRVFPIPRPPNPCKETGSCFTPNLKYIVFSDKLRSLEVKIYDEDGQLLAITDKEELSPLPGVNELQYQKIELDKEYTGPITLDITRIDTQNKVTNYQTQGNISH